MRAVVAAIAPDLKDAGFRKRRHSFNRTTEPGVVQALDFQMAPYRVPPGLPVPPALVDGSFTVNVGVHVEALVREPFERPTGDWVGTYNCQVRTRLGALVEGHDYWWSLADVSIAADAVRSAVRDYALPWLDGLVTERAAIEKHERDERFFADTDASSDDLLMRFMLDPETRDFVLAQMTVGQEIRSHEDLRMSGIARVQIAVGPTVVYAAVADLPRMGEWSPENLGGEWIDSTGAAVGAQFRGRNRNAQGEFETIATIIEAEPSRSFAFCVAPPGEVGTIWRYAFEPQGEGTLVTESFEWHWTPFPDGFRGRVGKMPIDEAREAVAERRRHLQGQVEGTLAALKRALESA